MVNPNAVLISNVDDYLTPSQACINPLYNNSSNGSGDGNKNSDEKKEDATTNVVVPKARKRRPRMTSDKGNGNVMPATAEEPKKSDPIKASMADCLACSGCVTTAETVLLEQNHSLTALRKAMSTVQHKTMVATISPAVWADLLRHLQVPPNEKQLWQRKFVTALRRVLNVSYVMDGNVPLQWSLLEAGEEFCRAYQANHHHHQQQQQDTVDEMRVLDEKETPSVALNAYETQYLLPDGTTKLHSMQQNLTQIHLPLLTSSCPALVCLVEKSTHPAVRHLSKTKSPMSMAGVWWRQQKQILTDIFHLAIMPCHDKKLEASRKDFTNPSNQEQDVDIVLTTQEWLQMMDEWLQQQQNESWSKEEANKKVRDFVASLPPAQVLSSGSNDALQNPQVNDSAHNTGTLLLPSRGSTGWENGAMEFENETAMDMEIDIDMENAAFTKDNNPPTFTPYGSGGFSEFVFRYAAWRLFQCRIDQVVWKPVVDNKGIKVASARMQRVARNRDYYQATLYRHASGDISIEEHEGSIPLLKFGIAYGLQTVQRVLEPFGKSNNNKESPFDFVEAMACPSGCLNGGGQLRVADRETPTQTRERVSSTKDYFQKPQTDNMQQPLPQELRTTRFHVVPALTFSMGAVAGVDVKDTQW